LLNGDHTTGSSVQIKKGKKVHALIRELSDDEEDMEDMRPNEPHDPQQPWLCDYRAYIDVFEQVPEGWTAFQWWGVSNVFFDVLTRFTTMQSVI
jgi:hypothetical protein